MRKMGAFGDKSYNQIYLVIHKTNFPLFRLKHIRQLNPFGIPSPPEIVHNRPSPHPQPHIPSRITRPHSHNPKTHNSSLENPPVVHPTHTYTPSLSPCPSHFPSLSLPLPLLFPLPIPIPHPSPLHLLPQSLSLSLSLSLQSSIEN